ncbi:MAG: DEAD/DEAH box helicase family protein [Turicibacter sp.]|nr:DEAD/DEAH box helicase family protein [Turicibacter sp.]
MEIDNRTLRLGDELKKVIQQGCKVEIAAATFSMYAFYELKEQLVGVEELSFIFNSPTFLTDETKTEAREYTIPKSERERSIFGQQYELKLLNELNQKAIAKECADWIKKKAKFKSINLADEPIEDGLKIKNPDGSLYAVDKLKNFDRKELGYEPVRLKRKRNLFDSPMSQRYLTEFEDYWEDDKNFDDVTKDILESLNIAYKENSPEFLYYVMLYNIFSEFLEDLNESYQPNDLTGFKQTKIWNMLFSFQKDAVTSIISKLEKFNGCILADSVGLGKTFTALAVITYYLKRPNTDVLVLCPKKLENNWNQYRFNYKTNPFAEDRLSYDVLFHTDLSRTKGHSNGIDLEQLNWENYDLIVIDESHAFRNGESTDKEKEEGKENRYSRLMEQVLKKGKKTKVLMLSATPVNNRFYDLRNQLALAYEGNSKALEEQLETDKTIEGIFRQAQEAYNSWSNSEPAERTTANLLEMLDFDFFKLLDSVTIARSRKHIQEFYDTTEIGEFPNRLKPRNYAPGLTVSDLGFDYKTIYESLDNLNLAIYMPSEFIYPSKLYKYEKHHKGKVENFGSSTIAGRERGIRKLMMINLLKRLESSIYAFRYTLVEVIKAFVDDTLNTIQAFESSKGDGFLDASEVAGGDLDIEDSNSEFLSIGKKVRIDLRDMDYLTWKQELIKDQQILDALARRIEKITPEEDQKLQQLYLVIDEKMRNPINEGNKKIIIFSAFAATTKYLYENVSAYVKQNYNLDTAEVSGNGGVKSTVGIKGNALNELLTFFSPISKNKDKLYPEDPREIDVLIATDVISEGQNLQDCDLMINYDIHWNPVRIVQRFGRVDRIGSKNKQIQMVNFWPNIDLDEYINLKARVESRMKISVLASTADDNILSDDELMENDYRKAQLQRLKDEVVDLEDMDNGISIMDLGLEDYRMDLISYLKKHPEIKKTPLGLQTVLRSDAKTPPGIVFVLKNTGSPHRDKNQLHPYYLIYLDEAGETVISPSDSKQLLGTMRKICKGEPKPLKEAYSKYNQLTADGKKMEKYSDLLQDAIHSIIEHEESNTMDAMFSGGFVDLFGGTSEGIEDFELICFFVVMDGESQ